MVGVRHEFVALAPAQQAVRPQFTGGMAASPS